MSSPRALMVGLDAMDRDVADRLIDAGRLPHLAQLMDEGLVADVENPYGMLSGPVWPTISTGTSPARHKSWTWRQLEPGTYRKRYWGPFATSPIQPFWERLAHRGVSFLALDVPRVALVEDPDARKVGRHIVGFRQHDLRDSDGCTTWPPTLLEQHIDDADILRDRCDELRAAGRLEELAPTFAPGIDLRVELVDRLFEDEVPDLAVIVFPEAHCAGHQFMTGHVEAWDQTAGSAPSDPLTTVYEDLDAALGLLLAKHRGTDTRVAVLLSHGMGDVTPVSRLIDPVLVAIDDAMGPPSTWARARAFAERAPNRLARLALRLAGRDIERLDHWVDSSRRFFPISVFPTYGAIRLNLEGREPRGRVSAEQRDAVVAELTEELLALRDIDTGVPLITSVEPGERHHPTDVDVGLPDLFFEWAVSDRIVRGARSERLGVIEIEPESHRFGNHVRDGRLVLAGPGLSSDQRLTMRAEDIAPTIAACVGQELTDVDGSSIVAGLADPAMSDR